MYSTLGGDHPRFNPQNMSASVPCATSLKTGPCSLALHISCQQSYNKIREETRVRQKSKQSLSRLVGRNEGGFPKVRCPGVVPEAKTSH